MCWSHQNLDPRDSFLEVKSWEEKALEPITYWKGPLAVNFRMFDRHITVDWTAKMLENYQRLLQGREWLIDIFLDPRCLSRPS